MGGISSADVIPPFFAFSSTPACAEASWPVSKLKTSISTKTSHSLSEKVVGHGPVHSGLAQVRLSTVTCEKEHVGLMINSPGFGWERGGDCRILESCKWCVVGARRSEEGRAGRE